jgi:hypothetical protein
MRYLKIYEEFQADSKFNITWERPTDEYIKEEMHELFNNVSIFLKEENFDKVYAKLPSLFHHIAEKYLKNDTKDVKEIRNLLAGKNTEQIGLEPYMDDIKENPTEEMKKEAFTLIRSGEKVEWITDLISKTGNMGDLTEVFDNARNSGRKDWMGKVNFDKGVEGINQLQELLDSGFSEPGFEYVAKGYLRNYDELLAKKTISKPAPFILNVGETTEKPYHLIGGHKRSCIALQLGLPVTAWSINF